MSEYFQELKSLGRRTKVELESWLDAARTDSKNATGVDTSSFARKPDLTKLKSDIDKLDIDKLKNFSTI